MAPKRIHEMIKIPKLATQGSKHTKLFVISSNICGELGLGESVEEVKYPRNVQSLVDFHIVKISCGSLHIAALTRGGKVVTWGCNDEDRIVTKSKENPNETDENVPVYVQGLDDIRIVKVACGSNLTLALSDKGQLYATGTFRNNNGKTGLTSAINNFGSTRYRQLGIGALEGNQKSPVQINLNKCKYIVTGDHHSMAVNNENK
ncbi:32121_t:CDS:2, partial [Gigaspora margarita]